MRRFVVCLCIMLAAAACSSEPVNDAANPEPDAAPEATSPTQSDTEDRPASRDVAPFDAVLIELLGTDDVERYRYDIERRAEVLLIECMADAGFEFTIPAPVPPGASRADLASPDFAAAYGFGIVDEFRRWIGGFDEDTWRFDINEQYVAGLRGAEVQRYFQVLDGEAAQPGQLPTNLGCRGRAGAEAYATWNTFFDALPNYTAIAEERDSHPDWLAARADWRTCMTELGFDYAEPEAIRSDVQQRMTNAVESAVPDGRLPLLFVDDAWVVDPSVEPLLNDLEQFEIEAAVANTQCTEPVADVFQAVEFEVQQGFVDRNRATIDRLITEIG